MPFLPYEATPLTTKTSAVVKREQSTKKVKCEDRFALPMFEFEFPDDYEDNLPTFLPSQLDQVCQQFMQSEVNMADHWHLSKMRNLLYHHHRLFVKIIKTVLECL